MYQQVPRQSLRNDAVYDVKNHHHILCLLPSLLIQTVGHNQFTSALNTAHASACQV